MDKLSPNYMTKEFKGMPKEIQDEFDKEYFAHLANTNVSNPKLMVTYSGGSAVGKSSLSTALQTALHGVVLENDAVRALIAKLRPELPKDERNILFWQYTMSIYTRMSKLTKNGLIIRDGVVDWYYDRVFPLFEQQGYEIFIVAFDISRQKREQLILRRGDKETVSANRLLEIMDEQDFHIERFRKFRKPDITLHDDDMFDHDKVIAAIKAKLETLRH